MPYKLIALMFIMFSTPLFADAHITVSKGAASLCEVLPTQYKKGRHYNKSITPRQISSDLWRSSKKGLGFFKLNKSETQSQTVQLAFVDKYSTFWYYIKGNSGLKGPYFYDFVMPSNSGKKFVDIDLELPCSCFEHSDKPQRCNKSYGSLEQFQDKFGNWWQQTGKDTAKRIGNKIGEGSHKIWDGAKGGWKNIKQGWNNSQ